MNKGQIIGLGLINDSDQFYDFCVQKDCLINVNTKRIIRKFIANGD